MFVMILIKKRFYVAALIFLAPVTALAGDPATGKEKAGVCASCHGQNGLAQIPTYPNLAGQNEQYLLMALKAYKTGQRKGGLATLMQGQAAALSGEDMANLAAYYASLPADGKAETE